MSNNENDDTMEVKKDNRTKWLHIRLSPKEHSAITAHFRSSTCRKLSEYSRLQLLKKPIIAKYRNESMDSLMGEIITLRNELNAIGNNFNQSVKKLHNLQAAGDIKDWLIRFEMERIKMVAAMEEIKNGIVKLGKLWLQ